MIMIKYLETVNFNNIYIYIYLINHVSAETLTTGRIIPSGLLIHQQRYRPSDGNKNVDI